MVTGAMWGDPDGTAQAMIHGLEYPTSPLQKYGPLSEAWGECLRRPGG
jgi:hypothetical protein